MRSKQERARLEAGVSGKAKRPAHRPPKYPGEPMTTLSVRLPVRLREKLARLSGGKAAEWVCARIAKARDTESNV